MIIFVLITKRKYIKTKGENEMNRIERMKKGLNEFQKWNGAAVVLRDELTNVYTVKKYYNEINHQEINDLELQGYVVVESKENQNKYNGDMYILETGN